MDFTIFKDEICKYIAEIWVFPRISPKYTREFNENIQKSETPTASLSYDSLSQTYHKWI